MNIEALAMWEAMGGETWQVIEPVDGMTKMKKERKGERKKLK